MEPRATTALSAGGLAALRRAAVMAHTIGTITLRLAAGATRIVDVRPDTAPDPGATPRVIDPCGFRTAVARAWADHERGHEVGLVGLGPTDELRIEWSVAAPGEHLGLGAVRAVCAGRVVWAFASLLAPAELSAVLSGMGSEHGDIVERATEGLTARLVHDELLGASVVHVEVDRPAPCSPSPRATRVLDEVLRRMVAVVGAAELTRELAGT
mgnify:FL=1|jgi:hypothetical protein